MYLKSLIYNGIPLGLFLFGMATGTQWALTTAIVIYWITISLSLLMMKLPVKIIIDGNKELDYFSAVTTLISKAYDKDYVNFNIIRDICIAATLSYFGFDIMAIFYVLAIFGYTYMFWNVREYISNNFSPESWQKVPDKLQEALDAGETKFSFWRLNGKPDPSIPEDNNDKWGGIR